MLTDDYRLKNLMSAVAFVALPPFLLWFFESLFGLDTSLSAWLEVEPAEVAGIFRALGLVLSAGSAVAGFAWWRGRLMAEEEELLESCHAMALNEPVDQAFPLRFREYYRVALGMMIMRDALMEYHSLYRRFFQTAGDMFVSLTPAGERILEANPAFLRAAGLMKTEVVGRSIHDFLSLDIGWQEGLARENELLTGRLYKGGEFFKIEAVVSQERGPEGQPWFLGLTLRDVTQREALHEELLRKSTALEKALEEIRSVDQLKDQFLTTLSHELKTPLVSLKGFLQLLRRGGVDADETAEYLDVCWRNLGKLETQINNLLDLARLSQSKEQFDLGPVDLAALVRMEAENLRPAAQEQKVSINLKDVEQGPVMVRGNADKLIQLVDNLLVNAIKYNKEDGEVRLKVVGADGQAMLVVDDSGRGIAREHMAMIFNRFYRADITGTGRLEGLGIGLSLVQEIVKLHQGDIRVESDPGKGTIFTVILESL